MKRTYIKDLKEGECIVKGYVENIRDKKLIFLIIRDVTGFVQVTINKDECPEIYQEAKKLTLHSFVSIVGKCVFSDFVKNGGKEIYPTKIEIESIAEALPISLDSAQDIRFDYRWIDLRDEKKLLIFKAITLFEKYATDWLIKNGFIGIHTPKISGISSEGGSEVFPIDYFGQKACLTQSPQLYKQMSMMAGFDKTYEIGEIFRSNPSFTSRHHAECTCLDIEMSYIDSVSDVMDCEENLLKYAISNLTKDIASDFERLYGEKIIEISNTPWPRIPLLDVYKILKTEMKYEVPRELKGDLDPEGERLISSWVKEKYNSEFLFVTDFPWKARAFYTKQYTDKEGLGQCYDLFFRGLEITSGAQREHRYENLKQNIADNGINPDSMQTYLDFFRYGAPPHGGFGLGIGRVMTKIFGYPNVREVDFIFRGPTRLRP